MDVIETTLSIKVANVQRCGRRIDVDSGAMSIDIGYGIAILQRLLAFPHLCQLMHVVLLGQWFSTGDAHVGSLAVFLGHESF